MDRRKSVIAIFVLAAECGGSGILGRPTGLKQCLGHQAQI
jgi:hypothetical protein